MTEIILIVALGIVAPFIAGWIIGRLTNLK